MAPIKFIQILCLALVYVSSCEAKVYSRCEFARTLRRHGIQDRAALGTWTCIAYHESRFNTKAVYAETGDYGILQISHLYWCSDSNTPGKGCGITCKSLLGDDITRDIRCAKRVYDETWRLRGNGFSAWTAYREHCGGDQTNWISGCNL